MRNWSEWVENGLPSSPTTIDCDMREGVPESRLSAYASCLGTTVDGLCSKRTNWAKKLKGPTISEGDDNLLWPTGLGEEFSKRNKEYNRPSYIEELFSLMGGVYRMNYLIDGVDLIHRSTLWVHKVEGNRMLTRGGFIMFGNENQYEAVIFRWHNNLHFHYLCENGMELGYCMTVDPLRHNLVRQRKPFWLLGTGMTDRGLVDNKPITFVFRMEQLVPETGMSLKELWNTESDDMRKHPFIAPGTPDYERIRTEILTPDVLTPEVA
ncbi:hypothetical protein [Pseudodesulfovibrio sp. zrk46]|uniref:hypothetical protein n=1 Tax=Pseudodesulfovibrio sp. zrk46 TaxID=2725288 RepID=UPI001FFCCD27|nr:hypothetical protein [Pseudodesulfovibrio sp. zrk46]